NSRCFGDAAGWRPRQREEKRPEPRFHLPSERNRDSGRTHPADGENRAIFRAAANQRRRTRRPPRRDEERDGCGERYGQVAGDRLQPRPSGQDYSGNRRNCWRGGGDGMKKGLGVRGQGLGKPGARSQKLEAGSRKLGATSLWLLAAGFSLLAFSGCV